MSTLSIRNRLVEDVKAKGYHALSRAGTLAVGRRAPSRLIDAFNSASITWVISPGRTGTNTLSHLLDQLPGVRADHEPDPQHRHILRGVEDRRSEDAVGFLAMVKAPACVWAARSGSYVEASHLYSKGFFEASMALGLRPNLLSVSREPHAVASSLLKINAIPTRSRADQYLLRPHDSPYLVLDSIAGLSSYQLCLWYALEIELRAELYERVATDLGLTWVAMTVGDMNDLRSMACIAEQLQLASRDSAESALRGVVGARLNAKVPSTPQIDDPERQRESLLGRVVDVAGPNEVHRRIETIRDRFGLVLP